MSAVSRQNSVETTGQRPDHQVSPASRAPRGEGILRGLRNAEAKHGRHANQQRARLLVEHRRKLVQCGRGKGIKIRAQDEEEGGDFRGI